MPVQFKAISPEELEQVQEGRRGRVSYPIIKGFMDTNLPMAEVILPEERKPAQMLMLLKSYVNGHDLPINILLKRGKLYMIRLDMDAEGNPVPNWRAIHFPMDNLPSAESEVIDAPPSVEEVV